MSDLDWTAEDDAALWAAMDRLTDAVYNVEQDPFTAWAHRNAAEPPNYGYTSWSPAVRVWPRSAKVVLGVVTVVCVCLVAGAIKGAVELATWIAGHL